MPQTFAARLAICLALSMSGCAEDTSGQRVPVRVQMGSTAESRDAALEVVMANGWTVHLEEAHVSIGSIYLRSPRRERVSAWRWLLPVAHAHPDHAQTLSEGQVIGEVLRPLVFDALAREPLEIDTVLVQSSRVERVSVTLMPSPAKESARGHVAVVRGWAERGVQRVDFDCGLDIDQDADDTPENLSERRRVDQIRLDGAPRVGDNDTLVLRMHPQVWLERVDFDALVHLDDPCPGSNSSFATQWYLGLRRPEAFSAELEQQE